MYKFFQKAGPSVAVAGGTVALAVATELLMQREEKTCRENGLVTKRVWQSNGTTPYVSLEVVSDTPSSVFPK